MKIDLKKFKELVDQKYLTCQSHSTQPLLIWNYSHKAQFDRFWTPETKIARGLITDLEGNIIARPFSKFFNLSEHTGEDSKLPPLPLEEFEVYDKMDGSLAISYWIDGKPYIATRGSFVSEQAIHATKILHEKYLPIFGVNFFYEGYTYLWEFIAPWNKIVCDYGPTEDLYLLAIINTEDGTEIPYPQLKSHSKFPYIKRYDGIKDLSKLQEMEEDNKEGFVIRFKSGTRVKCKNSEYVRLHRLVTGVNAKTIWEHLKDGTGVKEIIDRVPDEFFKWVNETVDELSFEYQKIERQAIDLYEKTRGLASRKEQALSIKDSPFRGIVFKMLDKQPYADVIWKMIRPVAERPYKIDVDL